MSKIWKGIVLSLCFLVIFLVLTVGLTGCIGAPTTTYIEANYRFLKIAVPDLVGYIEKDKNLSNLDKEARIKAAKQVLKLNKKAWDDVNK